MKRLGEIAERCAKATDETWSVFPDSGGWGTCTIACEQTDDGWTRGLIIQDVDYETDQDKANADFIAHARSDIPYLLDLLRQAAEALAKVREYADAKADTPDHIMLLPYKVTDAEGYHDYRCLKMGDLRQAATVHKLLKGE